MIENYKMLEDVVRESYSSIVWSHKIQEKQSDIYAEKFKRLETLNIGAASLTSVGIIAMIFTDPLWIKLASALVSLITVFITAYYKSFDLQKLVSS
ncbi:MAG: SLATT domain-containing protein, partial [Porphyromonadaceae bacterium]|nr:SLATT domain-containing protein [Porphyromonadaceae bacterium]